MPKEIRVGITIGDPSGIGPTIILKALEGIKVRADFTVIGDSCAIKNAPGPRNAIRRAGFIDLKNVNPRTFRLGRITAEYGRASVGYLDKAMELLRRGDIDAVVTCPISKEAIGLAGYRYFGHTEYLKEKSGSSYVVMMLLNRCLRFSLLTRHAPIKKLASLINAEDLNRHIEMTYAALVELFSISTPRIVVCGLNPHASDNGVIGSEENGIIKPALIGIREKYEGICGPLPADSAIASLLKRKFDCAVAMYHDQALIPLRLSGINTGVNITLGLPFIRTSPLHGTAFDIAPEGSADSSSLEAAIKLAIKCALNKRKAWDRIS